MSGTQFPISESDFLAHKPIFESQADDIMAYLGSLPTAELAERLGVSLQLAGKAHNLAFEFPHKITGFKALLGFKGEAYRALDVSSIPTDILKSADEKLRIVSSVYGILKPDDIIKPYRCEFNKKVSSDGKTSIQLYKSKITIEFVKYIKEKKINDVINLLPGDADKCFDWKIIRAFTSVHKVVFQTFNSEGKLKTPNTGRLKELRGLMFRTILEEGIDSFQQLKNVNSEHFIYSPEDSKPLLPVFIAS